MVRLRYFTSSSLSSYNSLLNRGILLQRNSPTIKYSFSIIQKYKFSSTTITKKVVDKDNNNNGSSVVANNNNLEESKKITEIYKQSVNRDVTWSKSQRPRKDALVGPRFEQTDLDAQPRPLSAIELIGEEPIHYVEGRIAVCHGGDGNLGHPQDQPGSHACGYCGIRFEQKHLHHH
nr:879_t:CDS:2 [Entrophospora candida]